MADQYDERQRNPDDAPDAEQRREFLRSLGKWSGAVIGGAALLSSPMPAASWINGGGGGGWINRRGGGSWLNGGGWNNQASSWLNGGGGGWLNGGGGGGWVNRRGGGSWFNR